MIQETGDRSQESGVRRQETGDRSQESGVRSQETGDRSQESVDNTGEEYVGPWLEAVKAIKPQQVMIYTIDRETPTQGLLKATHEQLDGIRDRVIAAGIPCTASY